MYSMMERLSGREKRRPYEFIVWMMLVLSLLQLARARNCGPAGNNQTCQNGNCCSSAGFCGTTTEYCGNGCQSQYGECGDGNTDSALGSCSATTPCEQPGHCCSQYGFCGATSDYCGVGCQSGACVDGTAAAGGGGLATGAIIGIAFGVAFAVILGLLICVFRIRRRRRAKLRSHQHGDGAEAADLERSDEDELNERSAIDHSIVAGKVIGYSYESLNDATNGFVKELGRGAYGVVYKGILADGSEVAVKKLLDSQRGVKDFEAEIRTLGSINHANLVALRGFCIRRNQPLLVYEYVPNGSLDNWIFPMDKFLPWATRVSIARGTTKGLSYLHQELQIGQAIIHLDIKPENILLNEEFVPKVADFGMAKLIGQTRTQTIASGGTFGYMAPEVYAGSANAKMDVYSFGIVLLELVAGRRHLDSSLADDRIYLAAWAMRKVLLGEEADVVDPRLNGSFDALQAKEFITVALLCLQRDPDARPDMSSVFRMLEGLKVPSQLPETLLQELEMTERLVRRPTRDLGWKADAESFFIDFSSHRSYQKGAEEEAILTNSLSSNSSVPTNLSNTPLLR